MNIQKINKHLENIYKNSLDTHNIYTPLELCEEMINSISNYNNKSILVISNLEFLIVLKHKGINLSFVHYTTSCDIKKQVAISLGIDVNNIYNLQYNKEINLGIEENMKFDAIIMNPPYGKGNPELKFLSLCTTLLKDENSELVSIQPLRWLQDPLWIIKKNSAANKYKNIFSGKLEVIRELISDNGNNGFDARFNMNLAIFKIKNKTNYKYDNYIDYNMFNIIKKIKDKAQTLEDVIDKNKIDGIRVNLQFITAYTTGLQQYKNRCIWFDGKDEMGNFWCSKKYIKNQYFKPDNTPLPFSIKFNTIEEAYNFVDYLKNSKIFDAITKWYKSDVHIRFSEIPLMPHYNKKWEFTEICEYFNFNDNEINTLKYHYNKKTQLY